MLKPFQLVILGSGSASATSQRYPSAQVLLVPGRCFLIDCGEGTQFQIRKNHVNFSHINHIFISHLHGDHFFGLIGLLSSLALLGRRNDLHIFAHSELQRYTAFQLEALDMTELGFKIVFHPLDMKKEKVLFEDNKMTISSFPLKHRIPCCGFRFDEKPTQPNLIKEKLKDYRVPISFMKDLKAGDDFITEGGKVIPNAQFIIPPSPPRSYAYCSDTTFSETVIKAVKGVTTLYHEATFADIDESVANNTFHSTASQAARVAIKAGVEKLLLGHFSSRYKTTDSLLKEAKAIFPNTITVNDNDVFDI